MKELKAQIARTQQISNIALEKYNDEQMVSRSLDLYNNPKVGANLGKTSSFASMPTTNFSVSSSSYNNVPYSNNYSTQQMTNFQNHGNTMYTPSFSGTTQMHSLSPHVPQPSFNNSPSNDLISNLAKKLDEQTMYIKSLKIEQESNAKKLEEIGKKPIKSPINRSLSSHSSSSMSYPLEYDGTKD